VKRGRGRRRRRRRRRRAASGSVSPLCYPERDFTVPTRPAGRKCRALPVSLTQGLVRIAWKRPAWPVTGTKGWMTRMPPTGRREEEEEVGIPGEGPDQRHRCLGPEHPFQGGGPAHR
jgi:hypothetical protein